MDDTGAADRSPDAPVASAQVSGFDLGHLSPDLQDDIARLAGGPLDRARLGELAARIEEEQPRYVAAVRVVNVPAAEVRVVFVVAHMRDQDRRGDANARCLIERVEIRGISESDVAASLNAEVQTLVGKPLGSEDVDQVEAKVRTAFPDYDVSRRVIRGDRSGEILLLFNLDQRESARWLRFAPMKSNLLYHSDQRWGAFMDFPIGGRDFRVTPIVALDSADELIEDTPASACESRAARWAPNASPRASSGRPSIRSGVMRPLRCLSPPCDDADSRRSSTSP